MASAQLRWWQAGAIYQIYPRSFKDTDADGVGNLNGITSEVDYLQWLGVDAVWLSPIFTSPMVDLGYDVADYTSVDPVFGTIGDFDTLVTAYHQARIKVVLDFVPNHSSSHHPWFKDSRKSRDTEKRDWYVWRDPHPGGGPPNNWESYFGGSAWTYHEHTGQYYLHSFHREQPDLNWANPAVAAALGDALRWWLRRGVDCFRMDVLWMLGKDPAFRDNPTNPVWIPGMPYWERQHRLYSEDWPTSHDYARFLRSVIDEFDDRLMVAEVVLPPARTVAYYGNDDEAHLPLNFALINLTSWSAGVVWEAIDDYVRQLEPGMWPNWFVGNHDWGRISDRAGLEMMPLIQTLLITLRGTPILYYGDELAMPDASIPEELSTDPQKLDTPGRDREAARAPMLWTSEQGYGFTDGQPWLPFAPHPSGGTVAEERNASNSLLNMTRRLLTLRRENETLSGGGFSLGPKHPSVLSYCRSSESNSLWVYMNFSEHAVRATLPPNPGTIIFSTLTQRRHRTVRSITIQLQAYEALIIEGRNAAAATSNLASVGVTVD